MGYLLQNKAINQMIFSTLQSEMPIKPSMSATHSIQTVSLTWKEAMDGHRPRESLQNISKFPKRAFIQADMSICKFLPQARGAN